VVLVSTRFHHAILDARSRAIASQVGVLIVLNLVIGLTGILAVDNFAHVGGLLAGLWLGLVLPPSQVQTLGSAWQTPRGGRSRVQTASIRIAAVFALVAVISGVVAYGTSKWQQDPIYHRVYGSVTAPASQTMAAQPVADHPIALVLRP